MPLADLIRATDPAVRNRSLADACRSYLLLSLVLAEFAEGYLERYAEAAGASVEAILAWLPVLAAARLPEDSTGEERDRLLALAATI